MSVNEWGEHVIYGDEEIKVIRSYRIYNNRGDLVSTGIEEEKVKVIRGMDVEQEIKKVRERLNTKIESVKSKVKKEYGK
jgi:hypothetical protein